jgi:hypothetical protein
MSWKMLIVGRCFVAAALVMLASASAMAQRGSGHGGSGRGDGGHAGGGEAKGGGEQGAGQSYRQSASPQHPAPAVEGRTYSGSGYETRSYQGRSYQGDRDRNDWRGRGVWGDDRYGYGRDWRGRGWYGGWAPGWGWGYGRPGYYDYDDYDRGYYYGPDYYDQNDEEPYAYNDDSGQENDAGYYSQAVRAFEQGDYKTALRMVGHAEVDDPNNANVHLLATLAMFALGDYRGAAVEVHGFSNDREMPTWDSVYAFYGDLKPYTRQLRALEKHVKAHSSAPDARLLLGFMYLVGGYRDAAAKELQAAQKLAPRDRFAAQLLRRAGGTIPEMGAEQESRRDSTNVPTEANLPKTTEQPQKK